MSGWGLIDALPLLDETLAAYEGVLDKDFVAYRNHCYRVANFCLALRAPDPDTMEKVAIASAFHDLGIWTDGTFDYLAPSMRLASSYLARQARAAWVVEAFRKADWVDVTRGVRRFGLPRAMVAEVLATWPNAGFHRRLVQLSLRRLRSHPWSPLPMVRW